MPDPKRVVRRVSHHGVADFDDQLWPINCLLLIMAAMVAGLVLAAKPSFAAPQFNASFFQNGWVLLAGLAVLVAILLAGTLWMQRQKSARRMQLAVLLAMFMHLWAAIGMYVVPLRFSAATQDDQTDIPAADEAYPVTLPDFGRPEPELTQDPITEPLESRVPDQEQATPTRQPTPEEPQIRRPTEKEPAATAPIPEPTPVEVMQKAEVSAPRRTETASASQLSRSETSDQVTPPTQVAPTIETPQPTPATQQPTIEATSSQQRQQAAAAAAERAAPSASSAAQARVQEESLTRREAAEQAASASRASLARNEAAAAVPQTAVAESAPESQAAQAAAQPELEASASAARMSQASAAQAQRDDAVQMNQPTAQASTADTQRADTPTATPQLTAAERTASARSEVPLATPSLADTAAAPSASTPAANEATEQTLQPAETAATRSQAPAAAVAAASANSIEAAQASAAVGAAAPSEMARAEAASGASQPAVTNSLSAALARAASLASTSPGGLEGAAPAAAAPAVAAGSAPAATASMQPGGTSVARLSAQQSTAASRAGGTDAALPAAAANVGTAVSQAASSRNAAEGPAVNVGVTAQLERASVGTAVGGGPVSHAPQMAAAAPANAGGSPSSGSVQASQQAGATGRIVGAADSVAAARGTSPGGTGSPNVQTGAGMSSARGTTGGAPQLAAGQNLGGSLSRSQGLAPSPTAGETAAMAAPAGTGTGVATAAAAGASGPTGPEGTGPQRQGQSGAVAARTEGAATGSVAVAMVTPGNGLPSLAGRSGNAPQVGTTSDRTAGLQRQSAGIGNLAEAIAAAPAAGSTGGPGSQTAGPSGTSTAALDSGLVPGASATRQSTGTALAETQRGTGTAAGMGNASAQLGAGTGPARATGSGLNGPQLASSGNGSLSRQMGLPGIPLGESAAELAEAEGPQPGAPSPSLLAAAGMAGSGPASDRASQRLTNSIAIKAPAEIGVGGIGQDRPAEAGLPLRLARTESQVLRPTTERFVLEKSAAPLAINAPVKADPAPAYRDRNLEDREDLARRRGGSEQSEKAVEMGLDFLARHQSTNGRWSLHGFGQGHNYPGDIGEGMMESDTAGTGLALLAFLGAGYTHLEDKYRDNVAAGLQFLIEHQQQDGDLFTGIGGSKYVWLYSHGIASIALCEAYGMTRDPSLKAPAQKALDFIMAAQNSAQGGWRYAPGVGADTSVSGWQLMALKSGQLTGLRVDPAAFQGVQTWLDSARDSADPSLYVYRPRALQEHQRTPSAAMTAEAMLMRLYVNGNDRDYVDRGAAYLRTRLPSIGASPQDRDAYYWYYATQVMFHLQGSHWEAWNNRLRPLLTDSQVQQGALAGSWNPLGRVPDRWGPQAGRIYVTAMHLLMLEVYYRHLPLFGDRVIKVAKP